MGSRTCRRHLASSRSGHRPAAGRIVLWPAFDRSLSVIALSYSLAVCVPRLADDTSLFMPVLGRLTIVLVMSHVLAMALLCFSACGRRWLRRDSGGFRWSVCQDMETSELPKQLFPPARVSEARTVQETSRDVQLTTPPSTLTETRRRDCVSSSSDVHKRVQSRRWRHPTSRARW